MFLKNLMCLNCQLRQMFLKNLMCLNCQKYLKNLKNLMFLKNLMHLILMCLTFLMNQ